MIEVGGLDKQARWAKEYTTTDQSGGDRNAFPIEGGGPTSVKSTHDATESDDD